MLRSGEQVHALVQAENLITHKDEIFARPKRTWFVTEKEKKLVAKAAKVVCIVSCLFFILGFVLYSIISSCRGKQVMKMLMMIISDH